jgi:hypothetical protein
MQTTPEQQAAAAEAARKEGTVKTEEVKPAPAPQPMTGSPTKLATPTTVEPKPKS